MVVHACDPPITPVTQEAEEDHGPRAARAQTADPT
jgi:hypothetical protein